MVSSFLNPGFPPVHPHPPTFSTMVAATEDSLRETWDALFAPYLARIRRARELALSVEGDSTPTPMFAISDGGVSDPTPAISYDTESHDLGHPRLQGDGKQPRIPSLVKVHSVPPLFSSSPLLREIAAPSIKPQSKSNSSMAAHTNNSKPFLSNQEAPTSGHGLGSTKIAIPFPLAYQSARDSINLEEYGDYWSFNSQIICLCMLPSTHTNTTKRRHEVLTSLLSNFTNRKDKWYWILQFILAYYTGVIAIMYEDFLTDKCGWVNWYPVGKFVKKDFYALELFEKMSEKGSADKMEISHWRDLSSFEITNYIWNPFGCTIIVELLVSTFQGITATFHQYATSGPQIGNELSQFKNVEFDQVAKEIENMGVRWISLPTASILILLFEEMTARRLYDLVPISSATEAYLTNENSKNDVRLRNFSRPTNPVLSEEIACYMGLELGWIMIKGFVDEDIYVQLHESVRGCDVYLVQLTCPPANENFMELLVMSGACRLTLGRRIHEYMLKVG